MNKRSLQNSDNLLCNRYTSIYEKEQEDLKKKQDSLSGGLVNKCGSMYAAAICKRADFMCGPHILEGARALY